MRIEVRTPAEVGEVSRALQRTSQRRLADRQADGWAERDAVRLAQRARSLVASPASRAAKSDPWKGAIPEFDPAPEVRAHRRGKGLLVTATGEQVDGKIKAKAAPFQNVYFSSWGKIYSGYSGNGNVVSVPTPWILETRAARLSPTYNSGTVEESGNWITGWPAPQPQPPRWGEEAPGGYVNFDIGQLFGDGTPIVFYSSGAGQTAGIGWTFASNFDPEHPQFAQFDLTNPYREVTISQGQFGKTVYPAIDIRGAYSPGNSSLPPLQNPAAALKNFHQFTVEAICAAGGAKLRIDFNNMRLYVNPTSYYLWLEYVHKQSDPSLGGETAGLIDGAPGLLHHYAITVNNGQAFFHVDGKLMDSYSIDADFWTHERAYAGAKLTAGDLPIMMKAATYYYFDEQEVTTWYEASAISKSDETLTPFPVYVPYTTFPLTQTIPGSPPAAIQSLRFTPKPLYTNQDFQPPAAITTLHA